MKIGIISECQRKKVLKTLKTIPNKVKISGADAETVLIQLPYTIEEMEQTKVRTLQKAMIKAAQRLSGEGVYKAVFTKGVKQIYDCDMSLGSFRVYSGEELFFQFVPEAVRRAAARYDYKKISTKIGISEASLSKITEYLVNRLCYESKYMILYSDDKQKAKEYAGRMFDELGLAIEVAGTSNLSPDKKADIIVDVDCKEVRVGRKCLINGVDINLKVEGADVDSFDVLAALGYEAKDVMVKNFLNDDKMLTI